MELFESKILVQKRNSLYSDMVSEKKLEELISRGEVEYDTKTEWAKDEDGIAMPVGTYRANFRYK
ncbi:MAG: hypothetical protein KKD69_04205 [Euryarchaeota archaeon]|nr:hypothetical protein [Euryarchaeota archaeon]MBU4491648.1 hypothetical protein [Euryarchaeota archaeon]MCG2728497.1 hypothetical protein [Candidatus Methanoperedenaceae archaeon]